MMRKRVKNGTYDVGNRVYDDEQGLSYENGVRSGLRSLQEPIYDRMSHEEDGAVWGRTNR